jgi:hypothetical protein
MQILLHHERFFFNELEKFVKVFMDNVNIYSHGWEDHYTIWSKFFSQLKEVNLKLNNCLEFGAKELVFMGHVVDAHVVWPYPRKVQAIVILV